MEICDLAALVWWECLHAADDDPTCTEFADAARAVVRARLHPVERHRPPYCDL
jgi:hypothetical protein